ncbi:MAG: flagellar basal body-associated FliL family protein [Pseudomonadota bacterium]
MADNDTDEQENVPVRRKKRGGLLILIVFTLFLSAVGGGASYMGYVDVPLIESKTVEKLPDLSNTIFVPLPKIVVTLGENAQAKYLRAQFAIETDPNYEERVKTLEPRLMDVFNTYLRVVEEQELTNPERFQNLQAQMLRRARLVAGEAAIKNLLVQEFVLQ